MRCAVAVHAVTRPGVHYGCAVPALGRATRQNARSCGRFWRLWACRCGRPGDQAARWAVFFLATFLWVFFLAVFVVVALVALVALAFTTGAAGAAAMGCAAAGAMAGAVAGAGAAAGACAKAPAAHRPVTSTARSFFICMPFPVITCVRGGAHHCAATGATIAAAGTPSQAPAEIFLIRIFRDIPHGGALRACTAAGRAGRQGPCLHRRASRPLPFNVSSHRMRRHEPFPTHQGPG